MRFIAQASFNYYAHRHHLIIMRSAACNYYAREQLTYHSSFILTVNRYANREAAKHADGRADMRKEKQ